MDSNLILFNKVSLYNKDTKCIKIYGVYNNQKYLQNISIEFSNGNNYYYNWIMCPALHFYLQIFSDEPNIDEINVTFHFTDFDIKYKDIVLEFPFLDCKLNLDKNRSGIIITMCKDYSHRLEEWIQYNIKLGYSGIIIFDNTENKKKYNIRRK